MAHSEQTRSMEGVGVDPYFPAAHADQAEHTTPATVFCAWYFKSIHAAQGCVLVRKAKPARQNLQVVPAKIFNAWNCPVAQNLHMRFVDPDGAVPYFPATQVDHGVQITEAATLFD